MTTIYITEQGSFLSRSGNKLVISKTEQAIKDFPMEKVESIVLIGSASISSPLMVELMQRDITMTWLSNSGKFFGRLEPTRAVNIERQVLQFDAANDEEFCLELSKKWIYAKIKNSVVMLRRWARERQSTDVDDICDRLLQSAEGVKKSPDMEKIRGYEGSASKFYFDGLKKVVPEDFSFTERNRQPPRDRFNSLLSFAYTLTMYEVYTAITLKGLHPYRGFLHKPKRGHPALSSDLMEEWRPILGDSLSVHSVSHKIISKEDFIDPDPETKGIYLNQEGSKKYIEQFENRIRKHNQYLDYIEYPVSFRESIAFQVGSLVKALEEYDPDIYRPVIIR